MVHKKRIGSVFLYFLLLAGTSSCIGYKKTLYFQGDQQMLAPVNISETYKLRKGDFIQVNISSPEPEKPEIVNAPNKSSIQGGAAYFTEYYVNDSGYVDLPLTGKVKVIGYSILQVDSLITVKAKDYLNFYTVDVKLASFKILALGEFKSPGQHYIANETCTIYEAIAIAGDATDFANKTRVQLIRTLSDGSKKIYHLDLTDYSGFNQENYYVAPYDIIYIEPQKAKVDKQNVAYITIGLAAFSTLLILLGRF